MNQLEIKKPYLDKETILHLPQNTLVVLCGISGSGKSTFASRHFPETYVISSDRFRALISDDMRNQAINQETFDLVYYLTGLRLKNGRPTIIDSTALRDFTRQTLLKIARNYNFRTLLLVIDVPEEVGRARDAARTDPPPVGAEVIAEQYHYLQQTLREAQHEGFDAIILLKPEQLDMLRVQFEPVAL